MNWIPAVIALFVGFVAILYVVWPLLRSDADQPIQTLDDSLELIQQKDVALRAIKELEFDLQTGKLSQEDFTRLNYELRQRAIALIRRIDASTPELAELDHSLEQSIVRERSDFSYLNGSTEEKLRTTEPHSE